MKGVEWAVPRLKAGGRLYTHCEHGVGRGPLMGLAVMVAQGAEATAAYRALRQARWQATLNDRELAGAGGLRLRVGGEGGARGQSGGENRSTGCHGYLKRHSDCTKD